MQNGGMTILVLILLLADIPPPEALDRIVKRWHLSNEIKKYLSVLVINLGTISPDLSGAKLKQIIRKLGVKIFASLVLLKQTLEPNEAYIKMLEFAESWQVPVMPVTGKDLIALGVKEGRELGEKLHTLEIIWEDSDYRLGKEELLAKYRNRA